MNSPSNTLGGSPASSELLAPSSSRYRASAVLLVGVARIVENRSIYVAPLIVAAVQVFALAISTIGLAERRRAVLLLDDQ